MQNILLTCKLRTLQSYMKRFNAPSDRQNGIIKNQNGTAAVCHNATGGNKVDRQG